MSSSTSSKVEGAVEQQHPDVDSNIDDSLAGVGQEEHESVAASKKDKDGTPDDGDRREDPAAGAAADPTKDDDASAGINNPKSAGPFDGASAQRRPSIANLISASTAVADQERLAAAAAAGGRPIRGGQYPYGYPYPYGYQQQQPQQQQGDKKGDEQDHQQYPPYPYLGGPAYSNSGGSSPSARPQYYYPPPYDAYPLYDPSAPPAQAQANQAQPPQGNQPSQPHIYDHSPESGENNAGGSKPGKAKKRKASDGTGVAVASAERPYPCTVEGCPWSFARLSDKRRHMRSHEKPAFHCPYWNSDPTCHRNGGAFNRLDVLKRHLRLVHFVQFKQSDSGWCRVCQKMFPSPKHFVDHCEKCAQDAQPTEWKIDTGAGTVQTGNPKGAAFTITQQNQPTEEPTLLSMSNVDSELKEKQDEHEAERRRSNDRMTRNSRGSNRQTLSQSIQAGHHPAAK